MRQGWASCARIFSNAAEGASSLSKSDQFLRELGVTWPNGYGANLTLELFGANYIPDAWVIGRNGKVAWNFDSSGSMADAIERALEQKAN